MACVNIASGVNKSIYYKKKAVGECFGDVPSVKTGATTLRRVTGNFNLTKETYDSGEIRTDYQVVDSRHGVRSVEGSLSTELSPASYSDFIGSALCKDFTSTGISPSATGISILETETGSKIYKLSRVSGSFLTDGVRVGMVVRLSGMTNASNNNKNLLVVSAAALEMNVVVLNGTGLIEEADTASSYSVVGKRSYVPTTGHTDDSYSFEQWYGDIMQSELYTGVKVNTVGISLPATGLVTAEFAFMGKDLATTGTSQFFTSPSAQTSTRTFSSVSGALIVDGVPQALITSLNVNIARNLTSEAVVGSNTKPDIEVGRITVDGDFNTLFANTAFADIFRDENEVSLVMALTTGSEANAEFMTITLPRIKINTDTKDDGEKSIVAANSYKALKGSGVNGFEATTIQIVDSMA